MNTHAYPHLSPGLGRLTGDSLILRGAAGERRQAFAALLAAWDGGDAAALGQRAAHIDGAVAAGLNALGLGRHPSVTIAIDHFTRGWIGHVTEGWTIQVDVEQVRHYAHRVQQPDRVFHALIHESLHARAPLLSTWSAEARWRPGYEEGMVEGLARLVTGTMAGRAVADPSYEFYVQAYRALAWLAGWGWNASGEPCG